MDNSKDGDSIQEINLNKNIVFGNKEDPYGIDLMRGIIINIRKQELFIRTAIPVIILFVKRTGQT